MKKNENSLTGGNIYKALIAFMVPIVLSTLLQQLYNAVDSYVVGNFAGAEQLAATGSTSTVISCLNALFAGISLGTTVVVARFKGAEDYKGINKTNATSIILAFALGLLTVTVGLGLAKPLTAWLQVPSEIVNYSLTYYRIYLLGSLFNAVYNIASGSLRALGDSRATLRYIGVASVVNVLGDFLLVAVFKLGVLGAALATALAMFTSCFLAIRKLVFFNKDIYLNKTNFEFDRGLAKEVLLLGLPNGLQIMASSFSNMLSQKYINLFGTYAIAGVVVSNKVNSIINAPTHAFSPAATTFTSQNLGAGNTERIRQGIRIQLIMSLIISLSIATPIFIFAPKIAALFNSEPQVISQAAIYIRLLAISEPFQCFSHIFNGTLRGGGNTVMPMFMTAFSQCVVKLSFIYIGLALHYDILVIYLSSVAVNLSMAILPYSYFRFSGWAKKRGLL